MLDEQFFSDKKYREYLDENFVAIFAYKNHPANDEDLYNDLGQGFGIIGTPTVIVASADGKEINRVVGYGSNADDYKTKLEKIYKERGIFP